MAGGTFDKSVGKVLTLILRLQIKVRWVLPTEEWF